ARATSSWGRYRRGPSSPPPIDRWAVIIALAALEVGGALLEEGLDTLPRILGFERLQERTDLDFDRLVDRRLDAVVHGFDQGPRGDGRSLAQLARERLGVVEGFTFLRQTIGEPDPVAFLGRDLRSEDQMLERQAPADEPRKALRAAIPGSDPQ